MTEPRADVVMPVCASCGTESPQSAAYCGGCGTPLRAPEAPRDAGSAGERRQLTVMFCDLVGSTALGQHLDPEDLRDVVSAYQECCAEAVERFDGHIAQLLGDGLLVYFGYPQAHEEDALRAVNAALAILEAFPRLSRSLAEHVPMLHERPLMARLACHTGPVVVGELHPGGLREELALGVTVNIASRLHALAEPGRVVISAATRRLVEGAFVVEDLGKRPLRGIDEPMALFRVVGTDPAAEQRSPSPPGSAPFVNRERELAVLGDAWQRVLEGRGRAVLVRGEAGIGKTRMVQSFREQAGGGPHLALECHCSPFHVNSAFHPVLAAFARQLDFGMQDAPAAKIAKLERALELAELPLADVMPLFALLLSLPLPASYRVETLGPEVRRRRTLEYLVTWLAHLTRERPAILVVEDLHWVDPSTLELLALFLERARGAPILALLTARPEFTAPWDAQQAVTELDLEPLTAPQMTTMVEGVAGDVALPDGIVSEVVSKADGVPLFVEELTRTVVEQRAGEPPQETGALSVPSTLQDSLMARLDRLGASKEVAQLASVLGREFSRELLACIVPRDAVSLSAALAELEAAGLIRRSPSAGTYVFKHALTQETAYQSLLRSRRREVHAQIVDALESHFPARATAEPEVMAWHCEQARRTEEAVAHYRCAGERALAASAHAEAIAHLTKALTLLDGLPESPERARQELALRVAIGVPLLASKGYGSEEVERSQQRARELCREVGEGPELYQALGGLYLFHTARAELKTGAELAAQLLFLGERAGNAFVRQWGHFFASPPHYYRGEFAAALDHAERSIALQGKGDAHDWFVHEHDADISARVYAAMALWNLGQPDRADERMQEAVALGRRNVHPWNRAFALGFAALFHHMRRERERVIACAEEVVAISAEQEFPLWQGIGGVLHGWARAREGAAPIDEILAALARGSKTGTRLEGPRVLGILAEIYRAAGRDEEGIRALDAALAVSRDRECAYWDAELQRLKGEALAAREAPESEECFRHAVTTARRQGARTLELRAAVSLARWQQRQGRSADAARRVGELYAGFREGRDTPDLREARDLLARLPDDGVASEHRVREG